MYPPRSNKLFLRLLEVFCCLGFINFYAPAIEAREVYRNSGSWVDIAIEDKQGHLWFTTTDGFVEFDGQEWWLYKVPPIPGDESFLAYTNVVKDVTQNLYFEVSREIKSTLSPLGTWVDEYYQMAPNGELSALIQGRNSPCFQWDKNPQSPETSISCRLIGQDRRHRVYLVRHQDKSRANRDTEFGPYEILRQEGKKWESLIQKYRLARYLEQSPTSNLSCLLNLDKRDRQWFSCSFTVQKKDQNVLFMVDEKETVYVFPNRTFLYEDLQGGIWTVLDLGPGHSKLSHFTSRGYWENFMRSDAPSNIWDAQTDRQGRIWVMTRPSDKQFALYTRSGTRWQKVWSFNQVIQAFAFDYTNTLWLTTEHAVESFRLDPKSSSVKMLEHRSWPNILSGFSLDYDLENSYINRLFVDHWNNKWFSFFAKVAEPLYYDPERAYPSGIAPLKYDGKNWFYFNQTEPMSPPPESK